MLGLADTIERRRGERIKAKGIYRDPVRSSHSHFVKASGLRWLSCMLLDSVPWAGTVWGLPFLTVLCPPNTITVKEQLNFSDALALVISWVIIYLAQ